LSGWSAPLALTAAVTKTCSPHTIGELHPRPGTSIFQTMFSVALQESGRAGSSAATPARLPRNCGQLSAPAATNWLEEKTNVVSATLSTRIVCGVIGRLCGPIVAHAGIGD
jgi:hypothetical protein